MPRSLGIFAQQYLLALFRRPAGLVDGDLVAARMGDAEIFWVFNDTPSRRPRTELALRRPLGRNDERAQSLAASAALAALSISPGTAAAQSCGGEIDRYQRASSARQKRRRAQA
jgi:hypothetical protein